jgi:hypothetical protein
MSLQRVKNILELLTQFETLVADYYLACAESGRKAERRGNQYIRMKKNMPHILK